MPIIVGRECSLGARWVLVGRVCRAPAPLRRANVRGARPCPLPLALPLPALPLGAERCPRLGAGVFMRGVPPSRRWRAPLPPHPPSQICVCLSVCLCVFHRWCCLVRLLLWLVVGGAGRSSVVLRPVRCCAHAGCRPMPALPRPPPAGVCAWRAGRPRGGILGGRCPLRFKCPRAASRPFPRLL